MTSIKLHKDLGGNTKGDTIEVTPATAAYLINAGNAEAVESTKDTPKRGRKTATKADPQQVGDASPEQSDQTAG